MITKQMTDRILDALKTCGIREWTVSGLSEETCEWFFVGRELDMRRSKDVTKYTVAVYRCSEESGKPEKGMIQCEITSSASDEEIRAELCRAYEAAQYVMNPDYALPDAVSADLHSDEKAEPLAIAAGKLAEALIAPEVEGAFLNSAEIFVIRRDKRMIASTGTDLTWTTNSYKGEYVVQSKTEEDVELYDSFEYDTADADSLRAKVAESLRTVRDRSIAKKELKSGEYRLILSGDSVSEILGYYAERSDASMIYSGYSTWEAGAEVQQGADGAESLSFRLASSEPFDQEGVPTAQRELMKDGTLLAIHGGNRFCRYLGLPSSGLYSKLICENPGTLSFEEMKTEPFVWAVSFSDFQMDSLSGRFGGEIRLAYYYDGSRMIPVTGGSVSGSLIDLQSQMRFSTERYRSADYEGPYAVTFPKVSIAGFDETDQ